MPWFRVDDDLPTHRKVLSIPRGQRRLTAIGAWTMAGAWSAKNLREGEIPASVIEELAISPRAISDLLAAGLWVQQGDCYRMHDFLDYNPTADQVRGERESAAARQRAARERSREKRKRESAGQEGVSRPVSRRESRRDTAVSHAVSHGPVTGAVTVPPTRPDPTRSSTDEREDVDVDVPREPTRPLRAVEWGRSNGGGWSA
jgi:hypothetical protein